jgi:hypothetical protein
MRSDKKLKFLQMIMKHKLKKQSLTGKADSRQKSPLSNMKCGLGKSDGEVIMTSSKSPMIKRRILGDMNDNHQVNRS